MVLLLVTLAGVCRCQLTAFHPFISAAPPAFAPIPVATRWSSFSASQYHAQDELGQASFGYAHPGQAASNFRDAWGNQVGSWAYIDPQGKEVRVSYVADSNGFRVLSNALPVAPQPLESSPLIGPSPVVETPEVQEAKRIHFAAVAEAKARNAAAVLSRSRRSPHHYRRYYSPKPVAVHHHVKAKPYHHQQHHQKVATVPVVQAVPVVQVQTPVVQSVPVFHQVDPVVHQVQHVVPVVQEVPLTPVPSTIISKYHSQDELGQASFGHVTPDQSASNFRDVDGNQIGHYAYINPDGQQIVVYYTAGVSGFRVLSNALPEAPTASQAGSVMFQTGPSVVEDTAEVSEARRAHMALFEEARNRIKTASNSQHH